MSFPLTAYVKECSFYKLCLCTRHHPSRADGTDALPNCLCWTSRRLLGLCAPSSSCACAARRRHRACRPPHVHAGASHGVKTQANDAAHRPGHVPRIGAAGRYADYARCAAAAITKCTWSTRIVLWACRRSGRRAASVCIRPLSYPDRCALAILRLQHCPAMKSPSQYCTVPCGCF